jgi:RNA polymerase sigma-70 factor (ECF subfamily)
MSSPPQGRALVLPLLRARTSQSPVTEKVAASGQSDEDAIARLQARDSNALSLLFDRYARLVLSIALRILRDYGEAEEVVQDVFFYVYQKASLFEPARGSAKAWIVQIAFHRALDRKAHLSRRGFYVGTDIDPLHDTLLGHSDLEHEVGSEMNRVHLERAFEELPEIQRRTLDLFYFQGLELREISERLNEPLGNVRHHFYRGLEKLRKSAFVRRLWEKQSL